MKINQGIKHEYQDGKSFECVRIEENGGALLRWKTTTGTATTTTEIMLSAAAIAVAAGVLQDYTDLIIEQLKAEKEESSAEESDK